MFRPTPVGLASNPAIAVAFAVLVAIVPSALIFAPDVTPVNVPP